MVSCSDGTEMAQLAAGSWRQGNVSMRINIATNHIITILSKH
jgi:hypothetical protein